MQICQKTDFDDAPYNIPNTSRISNTSFNDWVTAKEEAILRALLGDVIYEAFVEGLSDSDSAVDEWDEEETYQTGDRVSLDDDVFESLIDDNLGNAVEEGAIWTLVSDEDKWLKLKNGDVYNYSGRPYKWSGLKKLLVPYLYSYWVREHSDDFTGVGVVAANSENSTVISPGVRISTAYNDFARQAGKLSAQENSLFGYLYNSGDTFAEDLPEAVTTIQTYLDYYFKAPGRTNVFNL